MAKKFKLGDIVDRKVRSRVDRLCNKLYEGLDYTWGTDEEAVYEALEEANQFGCMTEVILWFEASEQYGDGESLADWIADDFDDGGWMGFLGGIVLGALALGLVIVTGGAALSLIGVIVTCSAIYAGRGAARSVGNSETEHARFLLYCGGVGGVPSDGSTIYLDKWLLPKDGKPVTREERANHVLVYGYARSIANNLRNFDKLSAVLNQAAMACSLQHVGDAYFAFWGHSDREDLNKRETLNESIQRLYSGEQANTLTTILTEGAAKAGCGAQVITIEKVRKGKKRRVPEEPVDAYGEDGSGKKPWERADYEKNVEPWLHDTPFTAALTTLYAMTDLADGAHGSYGHARLSSRMNQLETSPDGITDTANAYNNAGDTGEVTGGGSINGQTEINNVGNNRVEDFSNKTEDQVNQLNNITSNKTLQAIADQLLKIGELFPELQNKIAFALQKAINGNLSAILDIGKIISQSDLQDPAITELNLLNKNAANEDSTKLRNKALQSQLGDSQTVVTDDNGKAITRTNTECAT